jgi:hypothetical protein
LDNVITHDIFIVDDVGILLTCVFLVNSVLWILQMLSIWVHIIWEKRIKDPKANVEFEMQAAKLYIDWLQKVNLITSLHSLMPT